MVMSWYNYLLSSGSDVLVFFRDILFSVFPQSIVMILFLFPALIIVFALVRFFHDCFKGD